MRFNLRFDEFNERHARMTLFVNGAMTGKLCMTLAEALVFEYALEAGIEKYSQCPHVKKATLEVSGVPTLKTKCPSQ